MATVFMTVYGKQGLRELAEQNLAKAHYLAGKVKPRFCGQFFNEFVARVKAESPDEMNKALLKKKIIGGLALGRFYPELADSMLLCATEMTKRTDMDAVAEVLRMITKSARIFRRMKRCCLSAVRPARRPTSFRISMFPQWIPPKRWAPTTCARRSKASPK